jgi:hypothetical protein
VIGYITLILHQPLRPSPHEDIHKALPVCLVLLVLFLLYELPGISLNPIFGFSSPFLAPCHPLRSSPPE